MKIFRYNKLKYLINDIKDQRLSFNEVHRLSDGTECLLESMPLKAKRPENKDYLLDFSNRFYGTCWTTGTGRDCTSRWEAEAGKYGFLDKPYDEAEVKKALLDCEVCIQSTSDKLESILMREFSMCGEIQYLDHKEFFANKANVLSEFLSLYDSGKPCVQEALKSFMFKLKNYEYEKEYRSILYCNPNFISKFPKTFTLLDQGKRCGVTFDPSEFIDCIIFHPMFRVIPQACLRAVPLLGFF